MRVSITIDSADTEELRPLLAECSKQDIDVKVKCEGPEKWGATTDPIPFSKAEVIIDGWRERIGEDADAWAERVLGHD